MEGLKQLIKDNKYEKLESYINNNNILEKNIKNENFDLLFFSIENNATPQTVETILNCFPNTFRNINYIFRKHSPLSASLKFNNIRVAELLLRFNARIDFYGHRFDNVLFCLFKRNFLTDSSLRFLIGNKAETYGNKFLSMLITNNNFEFLDTFISLITSYKYIFILDLLLYARNKIPISNTNLTNILKYEKSKKNRITLNEKLIEHLCFQSNVNTLSIVFKHKILRQQFASSVDYYELLNTLSLNNSIDKMKFLLNQGININYIDSDLLLNIIKNNNLEMAEYVIDKGIYINNIAGDSRLLIWKAFELSHNNIIKLLIKHGADLFINDKKYERILELVIKDKINTLNIIPFLEEYYNAYVDNIINRRLDKNFNKSTLVYAIENQNIKIIKHLLQTNTFHYCYPINNEKCFIFAYQNFKSELFLACKIGNIESIKLILEKGININCTYMGKDNEVYTPLSMASKYNHIDVVAYLLDYGAQSNPEIKNKYKKYYKSPLIHACRLGNEEIVDYLINKGNANINEKDSNDKTIFMYACEIYNKNIIQLLMNYGCRITDEDVDHEGNNALHYLCQRDESYYMNSLLKILVETYHFDINKQNHQGKTPLHISSMMGNINTVRYLIDNGADINIPDSKKYTPFIYACLSGNKKIVNIYAIKKECNVNAKGYNGKTGLMLALKKGYLDVVNYLIKRVDIIDIDLYNSNGNSVFITACQNRCLHVIQYMVEKYSMMIKDRGYKVNDEKQKEMINAKNINGKTTVMYACEYGHLEIVKYLIRLGATLDTISNNGDTPLIYAAMNNKIEVVKFLLRFYPKMINKKNYDNQTALTIADQNRYYSLVKILKEYYIMNNIDLDYSNTYLY